ncbi:MAG: phosphopentomutase [Verrucomicrobia bacterium]|nr:phosphopentomutase [Verrucomicrobiota bacterium]
MKAIEKRAILIVLDGVGIGEMPDAAAYGDQGSHTLANVAAAVGGLRLPQLTALGLGNIAPIPGVGPVSAPNADFGKLTEASAGKDSTSGHWELAGLITTVAFPTYPDGFPAELIERFKAATGCHGILGNVAASGTALIELLGAEHVRTGFPIVYTSADSVFQIAAHEEIIPLPRLYDICRIARNEVCVGDHTLARVIARPFVGSAGAFKRTANRHDFSVEPRGTTLLDLLAEANIQTTTIGKVDDLFAGRGVLTKIHTTCNAEGIRAIVAQMQAQHAGLIFANLIDFDMLYGHRNDPSGFARALEEFDAGLPSILVNLSAGDLLIVTADHGNDPTTPSTDHSREYVPLLCLRKDTPGGINLGTRTTFADVGKTIADHLGAVNSLAGVSFLRMGCLDDADH